MSCARGVLTHLVRHLLTGHPNGGHFTCSPARSGGLGPIISVVSSLSPVTIGILTTYGCNFIGGGVKGDSSPLSLDWQLYHLLVWGCQLTPKGWEWLVQGWHHLRSLRWWAGDFGANSIGVCGAIALSTRACKVGACGAGVCDPGVHAKFFLPNYARYFLLFLSVMHNTLCGVGERYKMVCEFFVRVLHSSRVIFVFHKNCPQ